MITAQLPDGTKLEFPEGTDQSVIQRVVKERLGVQEQPQQQPVQSPMQEPQQPVQQPQQPQGFDKEFAGASVIEPAVSVASSIAAEPIAGLAGMVKGMPKYSHPITLLLNELYPDMSAADAVEATRRALTFQPRTEAGEQGMQALGETLAPIGEAIGGASDYLGDQAYEATGNPQLAAVAHTLPTAALEAIGVKGASSISKVSSAKPSLQESSVISAGEKFDVPVMTSDVSPPETYIGRLVKGISDKFGALGVGKARASQQAAREEAVLGIADNLDIGLDSNFAEQIVKNLNDESAKKLERAGQVRKEAVEALDPFGEVPATNTIKAIDNQIAKQQALKERANPQILKKLQDTKQAISGGDFTQFKNIRTEVISDLIDIRKGDDTARAEAIYQPVKSAIDKDMRDFAVKNDRSAAAKWLSSNRQFTDELDITKRTEIKRILNSGKATPEIVIPFLKGGKQSQLNRLYGSLNETGRFSARKAIIQEALKESKFFEVDQNPNPNSFANALNQQNRQAAINVFFKGKEKAEIDGLNRLLNATRKAQEAAQVLRTGETAMIASGTGLAAYGLSANPVLTTALLGGASAFAKAYESKAFRNLLLKLKNSKKGSEKESEILELAGAFVGAAPQVAKTEQE